VLPLRGERAALLRSVVSQASPGAAQRETAEAVAAVRRLSREADVTLVHGPHAAGLLHAVEGPVVLQVVDPWSRRVGMEAELSRGWWTRYRARKARQAEQRERGLPRRARLLTVGRQDAEAWTGLLGRPVRAVANGADVPTVQRQAPAVPTACFVGSLSYRPNIESVQVLVREVAPYVWKEVPETRFVIAGRDPDPEVLALAGDQVEIRPNVPSVADVFATSHVAVFPDRHGLGVRNSVLEALSCGTPVVASAAAAREQAPHPLLRVARDEADLADSVVGVLTRATSGVPEAPGAAGAVRSWQDVAAEYLEECRAAMDGVSAR
jgi:glycosyltransferase involved in cell wall biosynthesis